jgi:putative transposase
MIERQNHKLSIRKQCELLGINRSRLYYKPRIVSDEDLTIMNLIDEQYTETPFYGIRRMTAYLRREKRLVINPERVRRLMRLMGLIAVYPGPNTSKPHPEHKVYPYLLRGLVIDHCDQVWCADITYVRMVGGFMYLVAIMDLFSRYVLSWSVSNSLDSLFCLDALDEALTQSMPQVFNTDQGSQFTSNDFTGKLTAAGVEISMNGRGRTFDNIFVERLWRTVKYEDIYLKQYRDGYGLIAGLRAYFDFYNYRRLHQALDYRSPAAVYLGERFSSFAFPPSEAAEEGYIVATSTL